MKKIFSPKLNIWQHTCIFNIKYYLLLHHNKISLLWQKYMQYQQNKSLIRKSYEKTISVSAGSELSENSVKWHQVIFEYQNYPLYSAFVSKFSAHRFYFVTMQTKCWYDCSKSCMSQGSKKPPCESSEGPMFNRNFKLVVA